MMHKEPKEEVDVEQSLVHLFCECRAKAIELCPTNVFYQSKNLRSQSAFDFIVSPHAVKIERLSTNVLTFQ